MGNLFFQDDRPLEELLIELKMPSHEFRSWVKAILARNDGTRILENLLTSLAKAGVTNDRSDGLEYINKLSRKYADINLTIACADMMGKAHTRPLKLLEQLFANTSAEQANNSDLLRFFGTISHQAIYDLVTGRIPDYNATHKLFSSNTHVRTASTKNLLDCERIREQGELFEIHEIFPEVEYLRHVLSGNLISDSLIEEIGFFREKIIKDIERSKSWAEIYSGAKPIIHELRNRLFPIFGSYIKTLFKNGGAHSEYLAILTLLSWGAIIKNSLKKRILFKEIPILSFSSGLSGGRIDALELISINGAEPAGWQKKVLEEMTEIRFRSVGHVIRELVNKLNGELAFRIIDWKFAVGDGVGEGDILQAADVIEPIAKHAEQLKRYITLGNLDYYLAQNKTLDGSIWNENCPIKYGRLEYILATSEPVIHEITMTQSEQELKFKNDVVFNLHRSRKLAKIRHLNNLLLGCATGKTNGKDHLKPDYKKSGRRKTQLSLTESKPLSPIETVINKYRHFVDKNNIIEWVGNRKDRPIYLMHLDKLEMAFKQRGHDGRLIIKGRLDIGRGKGFICCLMPQHDDSTPSLHIDLVRGLWKCFGCGVYGFFAEHSTPMPLGQELKINYTRTIPVNFKRTEKLSIPEEHHKIMSLAQKILHSQFRNSPAQAYVQERCIDPELAYELGTGYGTDKIINVLLDSYSYDQLIHYGFIVISNRVTSQKGICQLLAKRGLGLQQIKREVRGNLGSTWGLPYSILHNRITFPLVLENRNTSFYGRATWPNCAEHSKHRKLTREYTGVPHGAFNAQVLRTDAPEIELSEGVFDAMSLIQLGYTPSMAMIGVDNYVILESIAGSEKDIGIAFDIDKNKYQTGQTNTAKIIERLQKMNYRGRLRNFTQDFIAANPDFLKAGKDFNEWLKYLKTA